MTTTTVITDATIRAFAIAKGFADVSVAPQTVDRVSAPDSGDWLVLSVKREGGGEWDLLGRRRTRHELLAMIQTTCSR